jgi:predicted MFS family arabinose efflux permease
LRRIELAVALAMFMDAALYVAVVPLLPYYADHFGLSKLTAGLVLAAYPALVLAVSLPIGALAGRIGGRRVLLGGAWLFVLSTVVFALAPNALVLALARSVQGVASAASWSAGIAWLTANGPAEERGAIVGRAMSAVSAGAIAGPAIGALGGATSPRLAFLMTALLALVGVLAAWRAPAGVPPDIQPRLREAIRRAVGHPLILAAMAFAAVDSIAAASVELLAPLALGREGYSAAAIGAALLLGSVAGIGAGFVAGRVMARLGARGTGIAAGGTLVAITAVFAVSPPAAVMFLLFVLIGPQFTILMAALYALAADGADASGAGHGVANALIGLTWAAGWVIGPVAAGGVARALGDPPAYVLSAIGAACLVAFAAAASLRGRADITVQSAAAPAHH